METDMNSYQSEFVRISCNYPLSHQYGTSVVEAQTSLPRNVPSGEIEAPRNGCICRLPPPPRGLIPTLPFRGPYENISVNNNIVKLEHFNATGGKYII